LCRSGKWATVQFTNAGVVFRVCCLYSGKIIGQQIIPADIWLSVGDSQRRDWVEMALSKPSPNEKAGPQVVRGDVELWPHCLLLHAHLLDRVYADGSPRLTSTLTVFLNDQGLLGGTLKDRDNDRAIFGLGTTLDELAESLEAQLDGPGCPWRADRKETGSSKRVR
jgi:hypothetical protein